MYVSQSHAYPALIYEPSLNQRPVGHNSSNSHAPLEPSNSPPQYIHEAIQCQTIIVIAIIMKQGTNGMVTCDLHAKKDERDKRKKKGNKKWCQNGLPVKKKKN